MVMVDDHCHDNSVIVGCDSCRVDVVTVGVFVCTRDGHAAFRFPTRCYGSVRS